MGERQFGPYRLVEQIAVGGMAEIHLAKTHGIAGFEKYVVLKMIHPNFSQDEQFIQMLIDEAKITVLLQHVNIAQTFDLGRVGDTYYITMEYVAGPDLYKLLRRASEHDIEMPADVAAYVAKEMSTGLDYAHRKRDVGGQSLGIVHRDVSPQNVLISHAGEVKLVDFGIAKATMRARQTAVGVIKGKYYYMSPEQSWGDPLDHRSDIFSAGIVIYEMLTGQMLYLEEDLHRLLNMVRKANIAPPTTLRRDIPPQLERIVMHALAKNPDDRYQTAGDLATDLERFLHVYSPVFTAAKVAAYSASVLEATAPPPPVVRKPIPVEAPPDHPARITRRVDREQLVQARSEFEDENSVIFRMSDMVREPADGFGDDTGVTDADALGSTVKPPQRQPRPAAIQPLQLDDLDDGEGDDRTVVSGPPGFGMFSDPRLAPAQEPTVMDSDFDEGPTTTHAPPGLLSSSELDEDGPTQTEFKPGAVRRSSTSNPTVPMPAAQAAQAQRPAVSQLHQPRKSRRTPAAGVAAIPPPTPPRPARPPTAEEVAARSESLLAAIVGSLGDTPPPYRPASIKPADAVPRVLMNQDSQVPANVVNPHDQLPPGHHQLPTSGQQPGFPLVAPIQTPNPFTPFPEPANAASLSHQLAALQLDEIPDEYKLKGSGARPWLLRAILLLLIAITGGALTIAFLGGKEPVEARVRFESIPQGATVTVDGTALSDPTPVVFEEAEPGLRYRVEYKLDGYTAKTKDVLVPKGGGDVTDFAALEKIMSRLLVTSKPRADVFVDDIRVGTTPFDRKFDEPPHTVELRLRGHKPKRQILEWGNKAELILDFVLER